MRTERPLRGAALLIALLALVPMGPVADAQAADPSPGRAGSATSIDAELQREVEQAAELERQYRAETKAAAARERAARVSAREAEKEAKRAAERGESAAYESKISEQQAIQGDLLWAVTGRGAPREADSRMGVPAPATAGLEGAEVRIAAPAPVDRELPGEIFDSRKVTIPSGQWGNREKLSLIQRTLDADGDGKPELLRYVDPKTKQMIRQEEDRNYDGVIDTINEYESGEIRTRAIDGNDDGNPDLWESYRDGRVESRELDRDDDGVRDVFYRYRGGSLMEERHDANNDGVIDLVIIYRDRLRVRAEEDSNRDGQMDVWITYAVEDGRERVARIERDRTGRGFADTFETFETLDGAAVLSRREEDTNGDGEIDVVSFYEGGKLRRRQISSPEKQGSPS